MTNEAQEAAFDRELHSLCLRYFNEFDLTAEAMLEVMVREEMFLICMAIQCAIEEDEPTGDWGLNGAEDDE